LSEGEERRSMEMGRVVSLVLVSLITVGAATAADSDLQRETFEG